MCSLCKYKSRVFPSAYLVQRNGVEDGLDHPAVGGHHQDLVRFDPQRNSLLLPDGLMRQNQTEKDENCGLFVFRDTTAENNKLYFPSSGVPVPAAV